MADLRALLAQIQREPWNRELRLVYADALTETGDPRGEFIVLQTLPDPTPEQTRRAGTLLRRHKDAWLGRLATVLKPNDVQFRDGFLWGATIRACRLDRDALEQLLCDATWNTVVELRFADPDNAGNLVALALDNPNTRALRIVRGVHGVHGIDLCGGAIKRPFTTVGIGEIKLHQPGEREALLWCSALPALERLEFVHHEGPAALRTLLQSPVAYRLRSMQVDLAWALRAVGKWVVAADESPIPEFDLVCDHWTLRLMRNADQRLTQLRCAPTRALPNLSKLVEMLDTIPEHALTHIVIASNKGHGRLTTLSQRFPSLQHVEGADL